MSEWFALGIPTRLLGGGDREQETQFFLSIAMRNYTVVTLKKYAACCLFAVK